MWTIYHNPRCGKSRAALELLEENGIEPTIVRYLANPPTADEIGRLARQLGLKPAELVRRKEPIFRTLAVDWDNDEDTARAIANHPTLLERPIVVRGEKAVVARPPERVLELIRET